MKLSRSVESMRERVPVSVSWLGAEFWFSKQSNIILKT